MGLATTAKNFVADLLGSGLGGFTSGDPQAGVPATLLEATFINAIANEINGAATAADLTVDPDVRQLGKAISIAAIERKLRDSAMTFGFTQIDADTADPLADPWGVYEKTARSLDRTASGAAWAFHTLDYVPDNSIILIDWRYVVVKASDLSRRAWSSGYSSFVRGTNAATSSVQTSSSNWTDGNQFPSIDIVEDANGYPYLEVNEAGLDAVTEFNHAAHIRALAVTYDV